MTPRTSAQTRHRRSPRACARCAQRAPFGYPTLSARPHLSWHIAGARQTTRPRVGSPKHGIGTPRRCGTVRILRIASMQFRIILRREPEAGTSGGPSETVGAHDHYSGMVLRLFSGEWRNGRRAGFRCQCPSGRGGSSPPSPTNITAGQSLKSKGRRSHVKTPVKTRRRMRAWLASEFASAGRQHLHQRPVCAERQAASSLSFNDHAEAVRFQELANKTSPAKALEVWATTTPGADAFTVRQLVHPPCGPLDGGQ